MVGSLWSGSFYLTANALRHFQYYTFGLVMLFFTNPSNIKSLPFPQLSGRVCCIFFFASPDSLFTLLQYALPLSSGLRSNTGFCQSVASAGCQKKGGEAWEKVR